MSESLYGFDPFENYWLRRSDAARAANAASAVSPTAPVPQLGGLQINPADLQPPPPNPYGERPALMSQPMTQDASPLPQASTPPAAPSPSPPTVAPSAPPPAQAPAQPQTAPQSPPAAPEASPAVPPQAAPQPPSQGSPGRGYYQTLIGQESGGDPSARNPRSSAEGLGQFVDGTWLAFAQANPQLFQGMSRDQVMAQRTNPQTNLQAIQWYARQNAQALQQSGFPATDATVALAHGFGYAGAANLLRADPNESAARVLGDAVMRANPHLNGMTAGQVVQQFSQRFGTGTSFSDGPPGAAAGASSTASGSPTPTVGPEVLAQAPDYSTDKALLRAYDASTQNQPQTARRDGFGLTPADWFGMAGGFFSGRSARESMGRGTEALAAGLRQADQQKIDQSNRAEDRAQRRVQFQQQLQLRRDTLNQTTQDRALSRAIALQRVQQAGERGSAGAQNVQRSEQLVGQDGTPYTALVLRDGTTRIVDANNQPVTDQSVLQTLQRRTDTGTGRSNNEIAEDDTKAVTETVQEAAAARSLRQSTANARAILQQNPNIVGSDWGTQGQRFLAQALGIQIGSMNPRDIQALERALQTGQMQDVMRLAPSLRPMSNVDLQMIMRQAPSVMANPQLLGAWLDQIDTAAQRSEARAAALLEARQNPEAIARMRQAGGARVWLERFNSQREGERRGGSDRPASDLRVPTRPGESYTFQPAGSSSPITIRRVN